MKSKTVFVGISGGVDSSVALMRLKNSGYNVVGVFIKVWHPDFFKCNWEEERLDAMRVAAHFDVPFMTCDAEEAYKSEVADYFIAEYKAGRTPNPDVMCNRTVKFGVFLKFALNKGADFVATGHYAQRYAEKDKKVKLLRSVDKNKDQTYFLWTLTQPELAHVLFPVGDSVKEEIRKEALRARIPVAQKKDSQGICFLGQVNIPEFLSHYIDLKEGAVINIDGEVIGSHQGALVYTVGQRHGFTITTEETRRSPYYVVARDIAKNTITVDTKPAILSSHSGCNLEQLQWISESPEEGSTLDAQFRYRQDPFLVTITDITENTAKVTPQSEVLLPAAGQSCVLYKGNECVGGGIISV